jgi:hypothetical protein
MGLGIDSVNDQFPSREPITVERSIAMTYPTHRSTRIGNTWLATFDPNFDPNAGERPDTLSPPNVPF